MRLTDAVFARMVVDIRSLVKSILSEQKADLDGEFMTAITEQPNEILKCAMLSIPRISRWSNPVRPVVWRRWQRQLTTLGTQSG